MTHDIKRWAYFLLKFRSEKKSLEFSQTLILGSNVMTHKGQIFLILFALDSF